MTKPDDAEYQKIQWNGLNQQDVAQFLHPDADQMVNLGHSLVFRYRDGKIITVAYGDYLFKDREGKLVVGNPA